MHPAEQRVHDDVRRYGWHIITVSDAEPAFAYTVGLFRTFGHPELLVLGLPVADVAPAVLNALGDAVRAGRRFAVGDRSDAALEGADVTFRPLSRWVREQHMGFAVWFYGAATPFPALQVVYPDRAGHWPWAPEATDAAFRAAQPVFDAPGSTRWSRFRDYLRLLLVRRFGLRTPSAT